MAEHQLAATRLPRAVEKYVRAMNAHDWPGVRASFAGQFERVGPFAEHQFNDPDVYTAFLADLLPTIENHSIEVTRVANVGDVSYVTIRERLRRDGTNVESYVCLACDLAPDGRIRRIEAFLRRTA